MEAFMIRSLFGFFKGAVVGAGMGLIFLYFNLQEGIIPYLGCGLIGTIVGILCGRAPWKVETFWVPLLRSVFGFIVGIGLYALGHSLFPPIHLITLKPISSESILLSSSTFLAPVIGALYGLFVELDDGSVVKKQSTDQASKV